MKLTEIAQRVNRSRDAVADSLRLLDLPDDVQKLLTLKQISVGQARALWKYRQFPGFVSALAAKAAENNYLTPDRLADLNELFGWQGPSRFGIPREIVVEIPGARYGEPQFDECKQCPFGARFGGFCLKLTHYDELHHRHHAEEEKDAEAKREAFRTQHGDVPALKDLSHHSYETIYKDTAPRGCGEDCPCRSKAVGGRGEVITICTDPKRFAGLKRKQTREDNAARRKKDADDTDLLICYIDRWTEIPEEAVHMMALIALRAAGPTSEEPYMRHIKPLLGDTKGAHRSNLGVEGTLHLSVPTDALIRAAVEATVLGELEAHAKADAQSVSYTSRKYSDFLVPYALTSQPKDNTECGSDSTTASSPDGRSGEQAEKPSSSTSPASSTADATAPTDGSSAPTSKRSRTTPGSKKGRSAA